MIQKHFRALFRIANLLVTTFAASTVWFIGRFFIADELCWRKAIFYRWARNCASIANMKIEVRGNPPQPPFFLVSNHLGYMDIAAYGSIVKCFFVAKSEVADWFLVGKIIEAMGTVFINRQSRRDILRAGQSIVEKIGKGENLIIFPEGTSSKGETVLPFKSSFLEFAAAGDFPVSYASISYRAADETVKPGESICWWGDADFLPHLWRLFQIKTFTATITFGGEPIKNQNRKELAEQLQMKISKDFTPVL